jgi:hypothetical protein
MRSIPYANLQAEIVQILDKTTILLTRENSAA